MADEKRFELEVVCTRTAQTSNKKEAVVLRMVTMLEKGASALGPEMVYARKVFPTMRVGNVYKVQAADPEGNRVYGATASWQRRWHVEEQLLEWETAQTAREALLQARRLEKKAATRNALREQLEPIRKLYMATNHQGRLALEIQVLSYLRNRSFVSEEE